MSSTAQDLRNVFVQPKQSASALETQLERIEQPLITALIVAHKAGVAVQPSCLDHALRFAQALPTTWPTPDVVVEGDGDIAFDWDLGRRRVCSVAVAPDGRAGFSALIDHEPSFGKVLLTGSVPKTIEFLMTRVLQESR